jgi:hypothetical protein
LYLNAWCECVRQSQPVTGLDDLSRQLLRTCLERRKLYKNLRRDDSRWAEKNDPAIAQFTDWLGRLGHYFAERGFPSQRLEDIQEIGIQHMLASKEEECLLQVAIESGLLIKEREVYYLAPIPLVEYCIGKHLANEAATNPKN